jgi:hypothetical protein
MDNNSNLGHSNHIRSTGNAYGSITDTTKITQREEERKYLNT